MKKLLTIFFAAAAILAITLPTIPAGAIASPQLVGRWTFDNGTANDSSGNGNNGALFGSPTFVDSPMVQAIDLNGSQYVEVPDSSTLEPAAVTVEAWVKADSSPGAYRHIVSKYLPEKAGSYSSYGLYTGSSGGLYFYIGNMSTYKLSPGLASSAIWDGNWHEVAGTYDGTDVRLYVDGAEVGGGTSVVTDIYYSDTTSGDLFIGVYGRPSEPLPFVGEIDEVRIWNGALTLDQLWQTYPISGQLLPPYAPDKAFKGGSTVPIKWQYFDKDGNVIPSADFAPQVQCGYIAPDDSEPLEVVTANVTGNSGYQYDDTTMTWQFNWKTLKSMSGTYQVVITSIFGETGTYTVQLR